MISCQCKYRIHILDLGEGVVVDDRPSAWPLPSSPLDQITLILSALTSRSFSMTVTLLAAMSLPRVSAMPACSAVDAAELAALQVTHVMQSEHSVMFDMKISYCDPDSDQAKISPQAHVIKDASDCRHATLWRLGGEQ